MPALTAAWLAAAPAGAGSVWTELTSPTATLLNAVKFLNRAEGWAVGDRGAVVRYAKGKWENFPSGTDEDLLSVTVLGTGEAWAVGRNGTIVHFNGSIWSVSPQSRTLTVLPLTMVRFLTPDIGWAVGGRPCQSGIALRYNGTAWVSATTTDDPLYGVEVLADDNVWFCGGNRRLMHFDGAGFTKLPCTIGDGKAWYALAFPFRNTGWVVGDGGLVWKYSSGNIPPCFGPDSAASSLTTQALRGISMLPGMAAGMVVGDAGVRLRFNGSGFELDAAGGQDLRGVDVLNEREGQAVGGTNVSQTNVVYGITAGVWPLGYAFATCPQSGPLGGYTDTFPSNTTTYFAIHARLAGLDYYSPEYVIAATGVCDPWDAAPFGDNTGAGGTNLIPTGTVQTHGLHCLSFSDPEDWFRIGMTAGCAYTFASTYPAGVAVNGGIGDVRGDLFSDALGSILVASDDNTGSNEQFRFTYTPSVSGTYYLRVKTAVAGQTWSGYIEYSQAGCPRTDITLTSWPPDFPSGGSITVAWDLLGWASAARIAAFRSVTSEVDLQNLRLYPNPVDPGKGETVTFDRLPADVDRLDIYTIRGELVASLGGGIDYSPVTGVATWYGRIRNGKPAATGSYPFRVHAKSGKTAKGLILVVKR
ncbi:MAG: hypothetical protein AAB152_01080 [Candidatus Coatesbacteria bacterium]